MKKKNFMESKMEVLLSEVEARKNGLFGTLSSRISNKRVCVWACVNAVGS